MSDVSPKRAPGRGTSTLLSQTHAPRANSGSTVSIIRCQSESGTAGKRNAGSSSAKEVHRVVIPPHIGQPQRLLFRYRVPAAGFKRRPDAGPHPAFPDSAVYRTEGKTGHNSPSRQARPADDIFRKNAETMAIPSSVLVGNRTTTVYSFLGKANRHTPTRSFALSTRLIYTYLIVSKANRGGEHAHGRNPGSDGRCGSSALCRSR